MTTAYALVFVGTHSTYRVMRIHQDITHQRELVTYAMDDDDTSAVIPDARPANQPADEKLCWRLVQGHWKLHDGRAFIDGVIYTFYQLDSTTRPVTAREMSTIIDDIANTRKGFTAETILALTRINIAAVARYNRLLKIGKTLSLKTSK